MKNQNDRDRKQLTGAATYFLDTAKGSHTLKVGGELLKELQWFGVLQGVGGDIEHVYNNGASNQVIFRIPTATQVGGLKDNDQGHLTTENALDHLSMFVNDTWTTGRLTLNGGVRWDRYKGWLPEQDQLGATVGPVVVQAKTFAKTDLFTWNQFAPRIGVVYDLTGDGRTVLKGNYGLYWHNPGVTIPNDANPNTGTKSATYGWTDINGDKRWQAGEQTALQTASLEGAIQLDPNIKAPYSHEAAGWLERQFTETIGVRAGFVYKTENDLIEQYIAARSLDVYTVPYTFTDIGVDGVRGTADDRVLNYLGLASATAATQFPTTQVVMNLPRFGRYKTAEVSMNKRYGNKWSASIGGAYTWMTTSRKASRRTRPSRGRKTAPCGVSRQAARTTRPTAFAFRRSCGTSQAQITGAPTHSRSRPGITGSGTVLFMEPMNANREDNIWVVDTRFEKTVEFTSRLRTRLFLDLFNITNSHASETISRATGLGYQKPSAILAPFTARVGFRFLW